MQIKKLSKFSKYYHIWVGSRGGAIKLFQLYFKPSKQTSECISVGNGDGHLNGSEREWMNVMTHNMVENRKKTENS